MEKHEIYLQLKKDLDEKELNKTIIRSQKQISTLKIKKL